MSNNKKTDLVLKHTAYFPALYLLAFEEGPIGYRFGENRGKKTGEHEHFMINSEK